MSSPSNNAAPEQAAPPDQKTAPDQQAAAPPDQSSPPPAPVTTNNFHQILTLFDRSTGRLLDARTTFEVPCAICHVKNLALLSPSQLGASSNNNTVRTRTTHEMYAVVAPCGHAFGYACLRRWFLTQATQENFVLTCPSCRGRPLCRAGRHVDGSADVPDPATYLSTLDVLRGEANNEEEVAEEMQEVRQRLERPFCERCERRHREAAMTLLRLAQQNLGGGNGGGLGNADGGGGGEGDGDGDSSDEETLEGLDHDVWHMALENQFPEEAGGGDGGGDEEEDGDDDQDDEDDDEEEEEENDDPVDYAEWLE
ncbi:hypothetical protein GGR56DRAFT_671433 [Xylariaceae sp. FL0804]|nr:hypothetical protein GGR56DRAFT_671433 [Xylariaceae sp. FL0804]